MPSRTIPATAPVPALQRLDSQVCFALYSASLAMTKLYKPLLDAVGLTYPQYIAMLALWERDGVTVSELGERLCLDSGTLTPLLKRLEALGYVSRRRRADDERTVSITLTAEGAALRERVTEVPIEISRALGLSAADTATLRELLRRVAENTAGYALTSPGTARSPEAAPPGGGSAATA